MKISVCIVTYKRRAVLTHSLEKLFNSGMPEGEVLVVDNEAAPDLPSYLAELFPGWNLRVLACPENRGCAALNLLFVEAQGEVVVCFDDDSYPMPGCLEKACAAFDSDPQLGMIGFRLVEPGSGTPWQDPWWNPECQEPQETVFCPGCGLAFRNDGHLPKDRLCLHEIVSQGHELSLVAEVLRLGYRIERHPECVACHGDTRPGYTGEKARVGQENQLRFLLCYADALSLLLLLLTGLWDGLRTGDSQKIKFMFRAMDGTRHPLPREQMRPFREILSWHIHPRLHCFLPRVK